MADTGYEINFNEASTAATSLQEYLGQLQKQITSLETIRVELLSDANWYGPNKSEFTREFDLYFEQLQGLYKNGTTYLEKLNEIIQEYAKAEQQ